MIEKAAGAQTNYPIEPICNSSHGSPDPSSAFSNAIYYNSEIFINQLLSSFNNTGAFTYLCNNLNFAQLDYFYLNDTFVIGAVYDRAGMQLPPRSEGVNPPKVQNATTSIRIVQSNQYAFIYAASASSDSELSIYCAHAPMHVANLNAEHLDGNRVQSEICSITQPLSAQQASNAIFTWTTRIFMTIIENVSDADGYMEWLRNNLYVDGMNSAGLIGWGAWNLICESLQGAASR